jgi:hypothetical protein
MFGTKTNSEARLTIQNQEILGVESLNIAYSNKFETIKLLGYTKGVSSHNDYVDKTLSVSRNFIGIDPLLYYVGGDAIDGNIFYNGESYDFKTGYINDYSINCAVGSIPKINNNIFIIGDLTKLNSSVGSISPPSLNIINQGGLIISCDNASTNRVVGFDYAVKAPRKTIYSLGSQYPTDYIFLPPLEYSATVQLEIDDAFMENAQNFLSTKDNKTIVFTILDKLGYTLQSLSVPNSNLISEQLSASADGVLKLTLTYNGSASSTFDLMV